MRKSWWVQVPWKTSCTFKQEERDFYHEVESGKRNLRERQRCNSKHCVQTLKTCKRDLIVEGRALSSFTGKSRMRCNGWKMLLDKPASKIWNIFLAVMINTGMSSRRSDVLPLENTWRYRGLSFSFCGTHSGHNRDYRASLWPDSPWICKFYSFILWGQGILAPNQQRTYVHAAMKLASFTGAGPARSTSCRTGPTMFSHLSVWPLWGFFAAVATRSFQQQGLRKLKLQKQRDTFNSCLSILQR